MSLRIPPGALGKASEWISMIEAQLDYIIVGIGAAGCVLANWLSEKQDCRVLVLEAGQKGSNP